MMLYGSILILLMAGLLAWLAARFNPVWSRWIALLAVLADLLWALSLWWQSDFTIGHASQEWIQEVQYPWIERFGISLHLGVDGLSLLMILLTFFLGLLAVICSWREIQFKVGFYHFNLLFVLAGITGVFLSLDLFLFYFFWEMMLIPMYLLIGIWGHTNRIYAAYKFFLFTQAGGLLMLLCILGLYFVHGNQTGQYSFDYFALLETVMDVRFSRWLMLGFLVAFLVKLPAVPLHTWLPDAHTEAPTAGSLLLAGLLLKTGAYGILRFVLPLFPAAAGQLAPVGILLGVIGILYGGKLAFAQQDLKRLIAYTSVSHMGFVLLGVFSFNELAMQGVVMQMIAHGISTGALFILAGALYERLHTRELGRMGGLWKSMPVMGGMTLVFVMASLGLPGLGNFIAEFLVLLGSWKAHPLATIFAAAGLVVATVYALRIMQRVYFGPALPETRLEDLNKREAVIMVSLILLIFGLGLYPQPVIQTVTVPIRSILSRQAILGKSSVVLRQGHILNLHSLVADKEKKHISVEKK